MVNGPSTYSKKLIMKMMLRFPWTTCEPAHSYGAMPFVLMCDPLCGNKRSRYPQKIAGNQGCWSRGGTRLTAADGSVKTKMKKRREKHIVTISVWLRLQQTVDVSWHVRFFLGRSVTALLRRSRVLLLAMRSKPRVLVCQIYWVNLSLRLRILLEIWFLAIFTHLLLTFHTTEERTVM